VNRRTLSLGDGLRVRYPTPSSPAATAVMKGNRSNNSKPEVQLRSALHRNGLRFYKNYRVQLAKRVIQVDIAFPKRRLAVFVDGCFWHGCPDHGRIPKSNPDYWSAKIVRNMQRDLRVGAELRKAGWKVLRVWEHESISDTLHAVKRILEEDI